MRQIIKNFIFWFLNIFYGKSTSGASILMYHSVANNKAFFTVTSNAFKQQLAYIKRKGYRVVFLSELVKMMRTGKLFSNTVCITFDDGYQDNYKNALPLLKSYNFPATIFVTTGLMGGVMRTSDNMEIPLITMDELKTMISSGLIECMPHTKNHIELDTLSVEQAAQEIEASKEYIESATHMPARIFAYPRGKYTTELKEYLRLHNWDAAVGVEEGLTHSGADVYALKRNSIDSKTSFIQFKGKLSNVINIYNYLKNRNNN